MYSKAKIAGHPIHTMLVSFPIAFYVATLTGYAAYWITAEPLWFRMGLVANVAAVGTAVAAAIPGFIDWAFGVPMGTPAKSTGLMHMLLQVAALALFTGDAVLQWPEWDRMVPNVGVSVVLAAAGVVLTAVGGALGWKMVGTHHVGVDLTPEQERLEPRASDSGPRPLRVPRPLVPGPR